MEYNHHPQHSQHTEYLSHDDSAVLSHMSMYQSIITRMANNSAGIKRWSLPLLMALLALMIREKIYALAWVMIGAITVFYFLDSYYLMLENRFRKGFNEDALAISEDRFPKSRLFNLLPRGSIRRYYLKALTSPATWPVYFGALFLVVVTYKLTA